MKMGDVPLEFDAPVLSLEQYDVSRALTAVAPTSARAARVDLNEGMLYLGGKCFGRTALKRMYSKIFQPWQDVVSMNVYE